MSTQTQTQTQDEDEVENRRLNMSRRAVLRRGAAAGTAVTIAGAGAQHYNVEPVGEAEAALPIIAGAVGVSIAGGLAVNYLADRFDVGNSNIFGDGEGVDPSKVKKTTAEKTWAEVRRRAKLIQASEKSALTTIENNLAAASTLAYSNAKKRMVESMESGKSKSAVKADAVAEVDKHYSRVQLNIVEHASIQNLKIGDIITTVKNEIEGAGVNVNSPGDVIRAVAEFSDYAITGPSSVTDVSTVNNDSYSQEFYADSNSNFSTLMGQTKALTEHTIDLTPLPGETGENITLCDTKRQAKIFRDIESQHSSDVTAVQTLVDNTYSSYSQGDIDSSDLVNGTDLANAAPENSLGGAAGDLAALGIEGAVENQMIIEIKESGKKVQGTIFTNSDKTLQVGTVYSPSDFNGEVWLAAYDPEADDSTTVILESKFEIIEATTVDGEDVSEVNFEETNTADTSDADIQELKNELQQLQELSTKLDKQRDSQLESGGGGGFFGGGSLPAWVPAVAGGGVVLWLLGRD